MITDVTNRLTGRRQSRIQAFAFVTAAVASVLLGAIFAFFEDAGSEQFFKIELARGINPNESPAASLARLPGIGAALSRRIVSYREKWIKQYGAAAFQGSDDLEKVDGIGPKTVQDINQWLKFE